MLFCRGRESLPVSGLRVCSQALGIPENCQAFLGVQESCSTFPVLLCGTPAALHKDGVSQADMGHIWDWEGMGVGCIFVYIFFLKEACLEVSAAAAAACAGWACGPALDLR